MASSKSNNMNNKMEEKAKEVGTVSEFDVLCGRGGGTNSHAGNVRLRTIVTSRLRDYEVAVRWEMRQVVTEVIEEVASSDPPGRFLKKAGGVWVELDEDELYRKVGQAFRDARNPNKKDAATRAAAATTKTTAATTVSKTTATGGAVVKLEEEEMPAATTNETPTAPTTTSSATAMATVTPLATTATIVSSTTPPPPPPQVYSAVVSPPTVASAVVPSSSEIPPEDPRLLQEVERLQQLHKDIEQPPLEDDDDAIFRRDSADAALMALASALQSPAEPSPSAAAVSDDMSLSAFSLLSIEQQEALVAAAARQQQADAAAVMAGFERRFSSGRSLIQQDGRDYIDEEDDDDSDDDDDDIAPIEFGVQQASLALSDMSLATFPVTMSERSSAPSSQLQLLQPSIAQTASNGTSNYVEQDQELEQRQHAATVASMQILLQQEQQQQQQQQQQPDEVQTRVPNDDGVNGAKDANDARLSISTAGSYYLPQDIMSFGGQFPSEGIPSERSADSAVVNCLMEFGGGITRKGS